MPAGALIEVQIRRSEEVRAWLVRSGRELPAEESAKTVAVAGSMQLVFEHHGAAILLARHHLYASLLALLRSIYEGYVLSAWLFRVASDEQIVELAHGRLSRGLESMVRDLDRLVLIDRPMLADMKPIIDRMNGFVHGGYEHLRYRVHTDGVEARYPEDLVAEALRFSDLFAVMTLLEWPAMVGDAGLGDRLYEEARGLLGLIH